MNDEKLEWTELSERELLKTRVFTVISQTERAAGGIEGDYISLEAPDCVVVIPKAGDRFLLVRQFRHGCRRLTTEFPGGVIDRGESPEEAARRELREETGCEAGRLKLLGEVSPNPALFRSRFYCFLADELSAPGAQHLDRDELLSVLSMPIDEVVASYGSPDFCHAFMGAALAFWMRETAKGNNRADRSENR